MAKPDIQQPPWVQTKWTWNITTHQLPPNNTINLRRQQYLSNPLYPITVHGTMDLQSKVSFWQIQIPYVNPDSGMAIGIGTADATVIQCVYNGPPVNEGFSLGYCNLGLLWHKDQVLQFSDPWPPGPVTISFLFDGVNDILKIWQNENYLGIALDNMSKIKQPIYPLVSADFSMENVTLINQGMRPLTTYNLQDISLSKVSQHIIQHISDIVHVGRTLQSHTLTTEIRNKIYKHITAGRGSPTTGHRPQGTGPLGTGHRPQATGHVPQASGGRAPL